MYCAGEVARLGEIASGSKQKRRVSVMAAGMHLASEFRLVRTLRLLRHGQRIHVRAKADGAGAVAHLQGSNHSRFAQPPMHPKACLLQQGSDNSARPLLLETQLRMGMKILAQSA